MGLIRLAIAQPVSVISLTLLLLLGGIVALRQLPIQLTPSIDDTVISVSTRWVGAGPEEIEREIVDPQEDQLKGIPGLDRMTSTSAQGVGTVRLQFRLGIDKEAALRETSERLRRVRQVPETAEEPVVEASDPENRDFIAWMVLSTTDPDLDVRTLQDFAEDRIKPRIERVAGVSQVNVIGGREREVQIRFDPVALASLGLVPSDLRQTILAANRDVSAGQVADAKFDVRLRTMGQVTEAPDLERLVIAETPLGAVLLRDVAEVVETHRKADSFVRNRGRGVIALNAQREPGSNVIEVMRGIRGEIARMNEPQGLLDRAAASMGLAGSLSLDQVFDQTVYIDQAIALVRNNIWLGGTLAIVILLLFLRSIRGLFVIAIAIPISIVGTVVAMTALGRSVNVVSLAGMAFAVGLVIDNGIVVLENIYRHLEMGKKPAQAAFDGAREVWGAVLAATLTTAVVFAPILLIEEEAGQLFADLGLAIVAAVGFSLLVSITVVPSAAARWLKPRRVEAPTRPRGVAVLVARLIHFLCGSRLASLGLVMLLAAASIGGSLLLLPPSDYLPRGNRNLVFGIMLPPPGYNLDTQLELARRIETTMRPFWEAGWMAPGSPQRAAAEAALPTVPTVDFMTRQPGPPIVPPPIANYFLVGRAGTMFHGAIAEDDRRAVDNVPLLAHATRPEMLPGVLAFGFQVPLFRIGGASGAAVNIEFSGDDLDLVSASAGATFGALMGRFGPGTVQPDPPNFNLRGPEVQVRPDYRRLAEAGLTPSQLADAVQASGEGLYAGEFRKAGESIDMVIIDRASPRPEGLDPLPDLPIATPGGVVVPLGELATLVTTVAPAQINRVDRRRAVTLQVTPPPQVPLETALLGIDETLDAMRAAGAIPPEVEVAVAGSASKLASIRRTLLGDGTIVGTIGSSFGLALLVVFLMIAVLFQSFRLPIVIMLAVPLATIGGFAGLFLVFLWSLRDPYLPLQTLDVLTMLGFVLLIGVVVNNAILIVHQALNFMRPHEAQEGPDLSWLRRGAGASGVGGRLAPREAIAESVRTRVRPIFMSTLTSVGGMLPLVLMPGAGSELYRGIGSVVVGGLLVSAVFTILLVPLFMNVFMPRRVLVLEPAPEMPAAAAAANP